MTSPRLTAKTGKLALAVLGLGFAGLAVGATEPEFPVMGRGDQSMTSGACPAHLIDGVKVCTPIVELSAGVSVVTVAPGLSVVQ
jgi:hypothetical protein